MEERSSPKELLNQIQMKIKNRFNRLKIKSQKKVNLKNKPKSIVNNHQKNNQVKIKNIILIH